MALGLDVMYVIPEVMISDIVALLVFSENMINDMRDTSNVCLHPFISLFRNATIEWDLLGVFICL